MPELQSFVGESAPHAGLRLHHCWMPYIFTSLSTTDCGLADMALYKLWLVIHSQYILYILVFED